jgi:hypothetical protein
MALIDLSQASGGLSATMAMVPPFSPAVYAFYHNLAHAYSTRPAGAPLSDFLLREIARPKSLPRSGRVGPYHRATISSTAALPASKMCRLDEPQSQPPLESLLETILNSSILLQTPLYIGKARNLQRRISQHMGSNSALRRRMDSASLNIDTSILLAIEMPPLAGKPRRKDSDHESIIEDVLSRLFQPGFVRRLG